MSVRINSNYQSYEPNYTEQLNRKNKNAGLPENNQDVHGREVHDNSDLNNGNDVSDADITSDKNGIYIQDEYVKSDSSGMKPTGTDNSGVNKNGNSEEKVIGSTDKVDMEIKQLKNKKAQLEQQLKTVSEDTEKAAEIKKKIMEVESELKRKDNNTYRKQHMETIDCYA